MNRENRLLVAILVALTLLVLVTGGLVVYLTLTREGGETGEVAVEPTSTAEPTATVTAPGEPRIAFVSDREGDAAICVMNADGSHQQRASGPDRGFYFYPSWSPDGRRVAYIGGEGSPFEEDDPDAGVWVSGADGSERVRISGIVSGAFGIPPTWSPGGTLLAFAAEGDGPSSVIHIARTDGGGITRSFPLPWMAYDLAWSPTRGALLLVSDISDDDESGVQMLPIGEGDGEEITEMFRGSLAAAWSPDGEAVVVGDYTSNTILIVERDREPLPVVKLTLPPVAVAWSPDGVYIAVATAGHHRQGYGNSLHLVTLETGEVTAVVEDEGWVAWPDWSPDSGSLLFTMGPMRQRPGAGLPYADLWLYDVASGELEQLTFGEGFDGMGVWSP